MPPVRQLTDYPGYIYAALLLLGAFMGGLRGRSKMSLYVGGSSGLAALYGARLVSEDNSNVMLPLAVAALLTAVMGFRFFWTWKFLPFGWVMTHSMFMVCWYAILAAPFAEHAEGFYT